MNKTAWLLACLICGFILESVFSLNVYLLMIIMTLLFAFIWQIQDQNNMLATQKEQQELQLKVQSTAKDAHLKYKQLMTMVSSIPSPLLLLNQFGKIVLHNDVVKITSGNFAEEETYLRNGYVREVQEFIKDAFILEKQLERRIELQGTEFQAISVPVVSHGKFSGTLLLFQDISKALEGEKMQKQFLADASHELKTPIAVIKGMVEILNRDDFSDLETQKDFLCQIEQEVNRLDLLVKDILTLSRLSSSHPLLDRRKINLQELVETAVQSLKKAAAEKGLSIHTSYALKDSVFCDPMRMRQVVTNLLNNAIKYTDQGRITISLYEEDTNVVIEVSDTGCGLTEEQQEKIWDRFYRVKDDRSRKSGGSGLGLAIVKSIVHAHNGEIEVSSQEHHGTTFRILLRN